MSAWEFSRSTSYPDECDHCCNNEATRPDLFAVHPSCHRSFVTPQLLEGNAHILSILAGKIPLKCAHVLYAFAGIFRTKLD
jgi:hypothetical protein